MEIPCTSTGVLSQLSRDRWTVSPLGVKTKLEENNRYRRLLVVRLVTTLRDEDSAEYLVEHLRGTSRGNQARVFTGTIRGQLMTRRKPPYTGPFVRAHFTP